MSVTTKVVLSAVSTVLFIFAACFLAATIALAWLSETQRSPEGFVTSQVVSMSTGGHAITSTDIDLESLPDEWVPANIVGTFQVQAQSDAGSPLFIGVGPTSDVSDFLTDVGYSEVTRFGNQEKLTYAEHTGSTTPQPPGDLGFWTVSAEGSGRQTLDWEPESGDWTLVVMNSDASSGLDVSASIGVNIPWIPVAVWVVGALTVLIAVAGAVIAVLASKQSNNAETSDKESPEPAPLSS